MEKHKGKYDVEWAKMKRNIAIKKLTLRLKLRHSISIHIELYFDVKNVALIVSFFPDIGPLVKQTMWTFNDVLSNQKTQKPRGK